MPSSTPSPAMRIMSSDFTIYSPHSSIMALFGDSMVAISRGGSSIGCHTAAGQSTTLLGERGCGSGGGTRDRTKWRESITYETVLCMKIK